MSRITIGVLKKQGKQADSPCSSSRGRLCEVGMHTLNRGLVEQHVAVYGRRDAHWMASWRVESLDVWTTLTLTVGQGQQDAMSYSSVHNSIAQRGETTIVGDFKWQRRNRAWPTSATIHLLVTKIVKGGPPILGETKVIFERETRISTYHILYTRRNHIYIEQSFFFRFYSFLDSTSIFVLDIILDRKVFEKWTGSTSGCERYDKSVNLIRGTTRSRGREYSLLGEARVNRVWESTRATLHGAKEEKRRGRVGRRWTWFVCIPRPWSGRQSSMEIIVAHGARCPSSTNLSLFPV